MKNHDKENYTFPKQSFSRAFTRERAGGSLVRGFSYEEAGVLNKLGTSVIASSGKRKKEPCLFFTPTFQKEDSGFYRFTGFKLRIKKGES